MDITQELLEEVLKRSRHQLENAKKTIENVSDDYIKDIAFEVLKQVLSTDDIDVDTRLKICNYVISNTRGLGPIEEIVNDKSVTEIMINGPDCIFIEQNGRLRLTDLKFDSREHLEDIVQRIVAKVNRTVDAANPVCDARLLDGSRVNIVLYPIALNGPIVTIRKFPEKVIGIQDLLNWNSITPEAADFLESAVKARYNIFVSGGTGSGKTTFLNALSGLIPSDERIITIEDSAELQIKTIKNLVSLETRNKNAEGKGEISMKSLIKSALRMRPDRIIVGEVRGAEALDMLQAMNTGHDGSLSTGHANNSKDMLSRLETMVLSDSQFTVDSIRNQIASAIEIIIHLGRLSDKSRRTLCIDELIEYKNGEYVMNRLFEFRREKELKNDRIVGKLCRTENPMVQMHKFEMMGVECKGL